MRADKLKQLIVPQAIATTNLRPDLALQMETLCVVYVGRVHIELAYERKKARYIEWAAEAEEPLVEIDCRGLLADQFCPS